MAGKLKKKRQEVVPILPLDVVETILSRLPVKSLLRFKIVSKSWQAIISNPRFSETFNIQRSKSQNLFLIRKPSWVGLPDGSFSLIKLENKKITESVLGNPLRKSIPVCSCNGIVLLIEDHGNLLCLWNPSIRKSTRIRTPFAPEDVSLNYGLYHDSRIDDYKVVIVFSKHYSVFSCKTGTWTEKKAFPSLKVGLGLLYRLVDGSIYGCTRGFGSREIVYFDVRDDKLKKLQPPNDLNANSTDIVELKRLSGRLCLYRINKDRTNLQLWVMEKHGDDNCSWRELMNMEKEEPDLRFNKPVCLTNEDNVVISLPRSRFIIYNHCEKKFEKPWWFFGIYYSRLFLCRESLFFPIQDTKTEEEEAGD